ncbi:MAG: DUF1653 domain-containing protein [Ruminococcus sp.]|nr:DUF1653 domain-containing protein [Ruminococcus sp.]
MREVKVGDIFRHFKGQLVKVLLLAKDSETEEKVVVYEHLDSNEIWVRKEEMFLSLVDKEKYPNVKQKYRFEKIEE